MERKLTLTEATGSQIGTCKSLVRGGGRAASVSVDDVGAGKCGVLLRAFKTIRLCSGLLALLEGSRLLLPVANLGSASAWESRRYEYAGRPSAAIIASYRQERVELMGGQYFIAIQQGLARGTKVWHALTERTRRVILHIRLGRDSRKYGCRYST